jgi:hypothetical protein
MSTELLTVEPTLPITEVAKRMVSKDVGAVLVFDAAASWPASSPRRDVPSAPCADGHR